jgi:hypothetical protein
VEQLAAVQAKRLGAADLREDQLQQLRSWVGGIYPLLPTDSLRSAEIREDISQQNWEVSVAPFYPLGGALPIEQSYDLVRLRDTFQKMLQERSPPTKPR